ncbi:hypothetical protein D5S18_18190 [Nocardia panacis]|uniref:Peptidase inhibitor family I36 protein n=1 Tax=Nocardia panacis TaxID=2340916 RepID=A0A3A4KVX0_9NOCA|nr:peptidase inhibitor family I36 protein [Nocardia panacis]RJO74091.1 hypothetical protein D5S18_18190 [Nocardia panacis]
MKRSVFVKAGMLCFALVASLSTAGLAGAEPDEMEPQAPSGVQEMTLCPQGWFCVWNKPHFQGNWLGGTVVGTCYTPFPAPAGLNSVSNQTGHTVRLYSQEGCGGIHQDIGTGMGVDPTSIKVRAARIL